MVDNWLLLIYTETENYYSKNWENKMTNLLQDVVKKIYHCDTIQIFGC